MSVSWRKERGVLLVLRDIASVLPAFNERGMGIYDHASAAVGYAWPSGRLSIGPSLAIYSVPACGQDNCARLGGISPGGALHAEYYFSSLFGASISATIDWLTGSAILPAGIAATVLVGPSVKWSVE